MTADPIVNPIALLRPQLPAVYLRTMIYDPSWAGRPSNGYNGQQIIPAVGSLVQDVDETPLWVVAVDPVTYVPSYQAVPLSTENDNVVSLINYGNSVLRLYLDYRSLPYPATPDSKCIFIGKSPRFYTLSRYPNTVNETIISQYYDTTGRLVSQMVPLTALDSSNSSWYLPRGSTSTTLDDNEEVLCKVYDESGAEVYSALLFAKQSAVINEDVLLSPTIVGVTVAGTQTLANGSFFLYEKQDFNSLGLTVNLVYDDGSTAQVPIDGIKCILYGQSDLISSTMGMRQSLLVKYYRSATETITPSLSDPTGSMISTTIQVTIIPNTLGTSVKIIPIPTWNPTLARYTLKYWLYWSSGAAHVDVTANVTYLEQTSLLTDSSHFGVQQNVVLGLDLSQVDPVQFPTTTNYTQNLTITFNSPTVPVKYSFRDSPTSQYIYGLNNSSSIRPSVKWSVANKQYFIPTYLFGSVSSVIASFFTQASPIYDPSVSEIPQQPTHITFRNPNDGTMLCAAPIPIANYGQAVNFINDLTGNFNNATLVVEFLYQPNSGSVQTLLGSPVDVSSGVYVSS